MSRGGYGQILRSSVFTGGAQVVAMAGAFIRMKVAAVTIGAGGVGMIGLLTQSTGVIASIAGLGLGNSAVREVASAHGQDDPKKLARVVSSLRVLVWATGLLGALICFALATPLSRWTFADESHAGAYRILGAALFMTEMANGQAALLRGLGKVRELAVQGVVISLLTTVVTSVCYWGWGVAGVVPALVGLSALTLAGSWWYARKVAFMPVSLSPREIWMEGKGMLRMGVAFVWSATLSAGLAYLIGIMVRDRLGLESNGFYLAAWGMSGLFVGLVLSAMGQDFYPRLTSLIHMPTEASKLINEQTEMGVLLALPGIVATAALATWLVPVLYSREFLPAAAAIPWFCLGCFWRITSFPFGYILIAKGESLWFAVTETVFTLFNLGLACFGIRYGGLTGVALAFACTYLGHVLAMRALATRLIGFRYTPSALRLTLLGSGLVILAGYVGPWVGLPLIGVTSLYCLRALVALLGADNPLVQKLLRLPLLPRLLPRNKPSAPA